MHVLLANLVIIFEICKHFGQDLIKCNGNIFVIGVRGQQKCLSPFCIFGCCALILQ